MPGLAAETRNSDYYLLPRDETEFSRLSTQHTFLKFMVYDGRLIFDESVKLSPGSTVLDSGTGSGAWVLDLANGIPSNIDIYGCDISGSNFPSSHPPNVHFHEASSSNFPIEWENKFDVINQRMLVGGLSKDQWPAVLSEYMRVTKPGGYVQIAELDLSNLILGGPATQRLCELIIQMLNKRGMIYDVAQRLPRMLKDAGFEAVHDQVKYGPAGKCWGKMGALGSASNSGAFKRVLPTLVEDGLVTHLEVTRLYEEMLNEFETVEGTRFVYHIVYARKAS